MIIVEVKNGSIEQALKRYKEKYTKHRISKELNERKEYKKPSVSRREEISRASYNQKRKDSE
jgi:small subunit ribosomal protein S21